MKILLVNTSMNIPLNHPINKNFFFRNINRMITVNCTSLQSIASVTPNKHALEFVDEAFEKINFNECFDLVAVSCSATRTALRSYKIADMFRKKGTPVVLGGYHPSALPEEAKQHADSVVIGEAENTWPKLLKDFENGQLKPFYRQEKPVDSKKIPLVNHASINKNSLISGIATSRGCPYGCDFCTIYNQKFGCIFRKRPIENVIEEIKSIPQRFLYFFDSSLTIDLKYTKELFAEMRSLNKKFRCWMNANIPFEDEDFLKLASDAGCVAIDIGFESFSQKTINFLGKKTNKVNFYKDIVRNVHDCGITIGGVFVFGFDTDERSIFDETLENIANIDLDAPRFSILTPFPGTPLFEKLDKENRILTKDWSKYDMSHAVFQPKHMSAEELELGWIRVIKETYSTSNVLKRTLGNHKLKLTPWLWNFMSNMSVWKFYI